MDQRRAIQPIDKSSIHKITSGQVVIDLQTAVKELVENSLDAGATSIEVRFKNYGLRAVEVIDNGTGIAEEYHENIALKHYTSKLSSFDDLTTIQTFGFRGEALSSLCALSESLTVVTATEPPLGTQLEMETTGKVKKRNKIARQRGTTVTVTNLFSPLPVRRKELERNIKREFGKALTLLNAYALGPCCNKGSGIKLTVTNQPDKGPKSVQLQTAGASSCRCAVSALWSSKALENIVDLQLSFDVERERSSLKRLKTLQTNDTDPTPVIVKGLISKFTVSAGRNGTDRQFFYVNGRPCNLPKIQKAFNEVYRSFNANQSPFILADFVVPTDSCDINVSPDKRTIFLQSESNLISALKATLEQAFAASRSTFDVSQKQSQTTQSTLSLALKPRRVSTPTPAAEGAGDAEEDEDDGRPAPRVSSEDANSVKPASTASTGLSSPLSEKVKNAPSTSSSPIHHKAPSKDAEPLFLADPEEDSYEIGEKVNRDREDVDNNEEDEEEAVEVLDTSQASWSQHLTSPPAPVAEAVNVQLYSLDEDITMVADDEEQECEKASPIKPRIIAKPIEEEPESAYLPPSLPPITVLEPRSSISSLLDMPRIVNKGTGSAATSATASRKSGKTTFSALAVDAKKPIQRKLTDFAGPGRRNIPKAAQDPVADENDDDELNPESATPSKTVSVRRSPSTEEEEVEQIQYTSDAQNTSSVSSAILLDDTRGDDNDEDMDGPEITPIFDPVRDTSSSLRTEEPVTRPEVIRAQSNGAGDVSLRFNLAKVKTTWTNMERQVTPVGQASDREASESSFPSAAGLANIDDNAQATEALARVIEKQDFDNMDILGQFNLGFIITRRRKHGNDQEICSRLMDDLFIVDQHAADEKYNFETLQATTKIKSQKLFQPQSLELTAADELVATENLDVLRQNGFEVEIEHHGDHVAGSKLKLVAQPTSKSTVFNMKDLEELIHLMRDGPSGQMVRCSKARAMFAMRACRKSVMIGMPLKKHQMTQVVQHMGSMDLPWNCPHGRPTMRHLFDLSNHPSHGSKPINWDGLT